MNKNREDFFKTNPVHKVLMVCLGNICRSPMAEFLLRDKLGRAGIVDIEVSSAGFLDMEGRHAASDIQRILSHLGISMVDHRSRRLSEKLLLENDLVVVMEVQQQEEITESVPSMAEKVWLLSQFGQYPEERDVSDPYGKTAFHYKTCYHDVDLLVEGLSGFLQRNRQQFSLV